MTDLVKLALIAAAPPTLAALGNIILGFFNRKLITSTKDTGESTNRLVNGQTVVQLETNVLSARTLANVTKDDEHERLAQAAEQKLEERKNIIANDLSKKK